MSPPLDWKEDWRPLKKAMWPSEHGAESASGPDSSSASNLHSHRLFLWTSSGRPYVLSTALLLLNLFRRQGIDKMNSSQQPSGPSGHHQNVTAEDDADRQILELLQMMDNFSPIVQHSSVFFI